MDSCFPNFAMLSPRHANKSRDLRLGDGRNDTAENALTRSRTPTHPAKNDVFQDLDLYYVRQIARNSKVTLRSRSALRQL